MTEMPKAMSIYADAYGFLIRGRVTEGDSIFMLLEGDKTTKQHFKSETKRV